MSYGIISKIRVVENYEIGNRAPINGKDGSRLGFSGMLNTLCGHRSMDGYKVEAGGTEIVVLIDNGQCCCESWGYMCSEDNLEEFIGSDLINIELTDTELETFNIKDSDYYSDDGGGIQFVTFKTSKGDFQLAVYNAHNGYYGHGIIVAENNKILLDDTL